MGGRPPPIIASRMGEWVREPANEDLTMEWVKLARRPGGWKRELAMAAAVGAFLGVIGPFGSYASAPMPERTAYWTACTLLGTFLFGTAVRIVAGRGLAPGRAVLAIVAIAALLSLPFAFVVALPARALWPHTAAIPAIDWYLQVLAVSAPLCAAWILLARRAERRASTGVEVRRQPGLLGVEPAAVLCLQMEDHYVRVHHAAGSRLVLTTMRQAQDALSNVRGLQVHRSWWVAESAVVQAVLEGRSLRLRLSNTLLVPVSRTAVAAVRAAGWLNRDTPA